jgi:hypothetical protein
MVISVVHVRYRTKESMGGVEADRQAPAAWVYDGELAEPLEALPTVLCR